MIEIKEDNYYLLMWFLGFTDKDIMGVIYKENGEWNIKYRFRYYTDGKEAFNNDEKNWYEGKRDGSTSEEQMIQEIENIIKEASELFKADKPEGEIIKIQGNGEKMQEMLLSGKFPWIHVKKERLKPIDNKSYEIK